MGITFPITLTYSWTFGIAPTARPRLELEQGNGHPNTVVPTSESARSSGMLEVALAWGPASLGAPPEVPVPLRPNRQWELFEAVSA